MPHESYLKSLQDLVKKLARIPLTSEKETGLVGYAIGAVYGLRKAINYGYIERLEKEPSSDYSQEFQRVAARLASSDEVDEKGWLAGFYFNCVLHRLAGLSALLDKHSGLNRNRVKEATEEVNRMHDIPGILLYDRKLSLDEATDKLKLLVDSLIVVCSRPEQT